MMSSNRLHPDNDPIDLLGENYEEIQMPDNYRRELQKRSRGIIAARRRSPMIRWTLGLAGCAALILTTLLAGRLMYSGPKDTPAAPMHKQIAHSADRHTKSIEKYSRQAKKTVSSAGHTSTASGIHAAKTTDNIDLPVKKVSAAKPADKLAVSGAPVVALTNALGEVTNERGVSIVTGDKIAVGTVIRTGKGGRATLATRNGSEINLDSNTELVFTSAKIAKIVRGRLYCSNHGKEIARIDTPAGHVVLLGTVVDANVVRRDAVAVTVVEGKVRLSNRHGNALVNAGSQSLLMAYLAPKPGKAVNTYKETSWYHGRGDYQSDFGDIAYTIERPGPITEVWVMKPDGSNKRRVTSYIGHVKLGEWVPGDRWIEIESSSVMVNGQHWLLNAATGQSQPFEYLPEGYSGFYFSTAPDPMRIAFSGYHYPDPDDHDKCEPGVYMYDRLTGKTTQLLNGDIKTAPAWAPDSRHIAISSGQGYTLDHNLLIIDADTGATHNTGINGVGASFSPDGTKIAYTSDFDKHSGFSRGIPGGSMFVLDLASGAKPVMVVPKTERAVEARWSPDGTRILYKRGWYTLCVVSADGDEPTVIYDPKNDQSFLSAAWDPSGDAVYVTTEANHILLVAADGSDVKEVLNEDIKKDSKLPSKCQAQTDTAGAAVMDAFSCYQKSCQLVYEGRPAEARRALKTVPDLFTQLVWSNPLSGLNAGDALQYANAAEEIITETDSELLEESCRQRIDALSRAIFAIADTDHKFPSDISALRKCLLADRKNDAAQVDMLLQCPGTQDDGPQTFEYSPQKMGTLPDMNDIIVSCPFHPAIYGMWKRWMTQAMDDILMDDGKPGECRNIYFTPYAFENAGSEPLTLVYHKFTGKYEVRGTVKLLPTGQVFSDEEFTLPADEGSMARAIDARGALDWGNLPAFDANNAKNELEFCRAVAKFEAGLPVTELDGKGNMYKTIHGEPAMLLYCGSPGGSCGAVGSDLQFELIGSEKIYLYQLKPSGRFNVTGTVKVQQTGQVCKDGWIDKDGNVISTQKN